jgi:hypothetical protein
VFLSTQFALPAMTICALYKARWQVELRLPQPNTNPATTAGVTS